MAKNQCRARGNHQIFAHADMIPAEVREDVEILSSKIRLVPALNGLYVNTNGTLLLVFSLWLVGVDVRSVKGTVETVFRDRCLRGYQGNAPGSITPNYINTSEIPNELSRDNFVSSHLR